MHKEPCGGSCESVMSSVTLQHGERRDMGKLNKSVISVDEEGGMSLKNEYEFVTQ